MVHDDRGNVLLSVGKEGKTSRSTIIFTVFTANYWEVKKLVYKE